MLLGTVLGLLLLGGGPASAHAALKSADPADGSVVKTAPGSITLTFTESIGLINDSFRVFDPDNQRVKTGKAEHVDGRADTVRATLPGKLPTGTFTVAWRVVSADSHPIAGAYTFSVGKPSATPPTLPGTAVEDPATSGLFNIGRYVAYIAAALLIGTAAFIALCGPPDIRPLRRLLTAGWWALAGSTVFLLLLRAPYETGTSPTEALDPSGLTRTVGTRPGLALLARLALLAAVAVLLLRQRGPAERRERPSRAALLTGAALTLGLTLTWAAAEHASAGIQVPAAMTSSVLHLLAMAAWLGGLAALLTLMFRASLPSRVVRRFSLLAGWSVTVLVVTGVYQSWRGLGSASALTDTTYGRVLLAKLAAVTLLLLAGAWSRRTVTTERTAKNVTAETIETVGTVGTVGTTDTAEPAETAGTTATDKAADTAETAGTAAEQDARVPEPVSALAGGSASSSVSASVSASTGGSVSISVAEKSPGKSPGKPSERTPERTPEKSSPEKSTSEQPSSEKLSPERPSAGKVAGTGKAVAAGKAAASTALTPAEDARRRALRRSVLVEVVVSVVVLVLTTVLTSTLPGRAVAEAAAVEQSAGLPVTSVTYVPFTLAAPGGRAGTVGGKVQVTLDPGRVGYNSLQAVVYAADGGLVTIPELRISFSLPAQKVGPLDAKVTNRGGYFASDSVNLPIAGTWQMKVTVRVTDVDQVTAEQPVRIGR